MKSVLMSIQPKWCELIASGKKTIEVRKTKPKLEIPFKVYIYCTNWKDNTYWKNHYKDKLGKVIGEFVCDWVVDSPIWRLRGNTGFLAPRTEKEKNLPEMACLSIEELKEYVGGENRCVCGWHISDLVIYDKPKELREFKPYNRKEEDCLFSHLGLAAPKCEDCKECYVKRAPQSWCYIEGE